MKKLMKAIAFATVMCMLLSVSAFASSATMDQAGLASVTIVIDDAAASKPIALVVAKSDVASAAALTSENILYIDQSETDANGAVTFPAVDTKGEKAVNVFIGYEGAKENGQPSAIKLVAKAVELGPKDAIAITGVTLYQPAQVDSSQFGEATDVESGSGATGTAKITVDEDRKIAGVIWAIGYKDAEDKDARAYAKADESIFAALAGNVEVRVGVAFSNGLKADASTQREITGLDLIVKTTKNDDTEALVLFTNEDADKNNENK